jgi:neutral ceramidase
VQTPGMWVSAALAAGALTVQFASVDVTPDTYLPLGGYTERGEAVFQPGGDRIWARAVVLAQGGRRHAIVALDALTVPEGLADEVRRRIPPGTRLALVATHTHCAPDSQMANPRMTLGVPGIADYDRGYALWLARRVAESVRAAAAAPPREVRRLSLREADVRFNRPRRAGARPDPRAWCLYADLTPVLAGYAAHPTLFGPEEMRLTGDWPAALAGALGCPAVTGAIGDAAPDFEGDDRARRMGEAIAARLAKAPGREVWRTGETFEWTDVSEPAPPPVPHPEFEAAYSVPAPLAAIAVRRFAPPETRVSVLRAGKLAVVFVGAEPAASVGRAIEALGRRRGLARTCVVSHANGWAGYVLDPEDYDRGGYEATLSFYGRDGAKALLGACARALGQPRPPDIARELCGHSR